MKIKDLPTDIQEYLFYELSCQHSEYTLEELYNKIGHKFIIK